MRIEHRPEPHSDGKVHVGEVWECWDRRLVYRVLKERVEQGTGAPVVDVEWLGSGQRSIGVLAWIRGDERLLRREIETTKLLFVGGPKNATVIEVDGGVPVWYQFPIQPEGLVRFFADDVGLAERLAPSHTIAEYRPVQSRRDIDFAVMKFVGAR